jgi:Helix-turn-helix domain
MCRETAAVADPVPLARQCALNLVAWEIALSTNSVNGGMAPAPEVRFTVSRLAMAAPGMARRLPRVRAVLPPDVLAIVLASGPPATAPAPGAPGAPESVLTAAGAAARLGVSGQAVRAAAGRGALPGRKGPDGRWRFKRSDVETYGESHGRR